MVFNITRSKKNVVKSDYMKLIRVYSSWIFRITIISFQFQFTFEHQNSSNNVLRARRGVIRMLVVVVFSFAVCHLPFHLRKIWQYWSPYYKPQTDFSAILTALTFLTTYLNSAVNPLLYAFLSNNFRRLVNWGYVAVWMSFWHSHF